MDPTTPPGVNLLLPQTTPVKIGISTTNPFTTNQKYCIESCSAMADEIRDYLVGPMPAEEFLNDFFPISDLPGLNQVPIFKPGFYDSTINVDRETRAYKQLVCLFDETCTLSYLHLLGNCNSVFHSRFQSC